MKAAFLTSSLIASKGKAAPATTRPTPQHLLAEDARANVHGVSRIYQRVREYAEPEKPARTDREMEAEDLSPATPADDFRRNPAFGGLDEAAQAAISQEVSRTLSEVVPPAPAASPATAAAAAVARTPIDEAEARRIADEVMQLKRDGLGRIRISVRMSPRDHLQLKLISAHTQMSAQAIFETALEEYIANHGPRILPQSCNCVLDKSSL